MAQNNQDGHMPAEPDIDESFRGLNLASGVQDIPGAGQGSYNGLATTDTNNPMILSPVSGAQLGLPASFASQVAPTAPTSVVTAQGAVNIAPPNAFLGPAADRLPPLPYSMADVALATRIFNESSLAGVFDEAFNDPLPDSPYNVPVPDVPNVQRLNVHLRRHVEGMPFQWPSTGSLYLPRCELTVLVHIGLRSPSCRDDFRRVIDRMEKRMAHIKIALEQAEMEAGKPETAMGERLAAYTQSQLLDEPMDDSGVIYFGQYIPGITVSSLTAGHVVQADKQSSGEDVSLQPVHWREIHRTIQEPYSHLMGMVEWEYPVATDARHVQLRAACAALCILRSMLPGSIPRYVFHSFLHRVAEVSLLDSDSSRA
jgi:hypothetical protein